MQNFEKTAFLPELSSNLWNKILDKAFEFRALRILEYGSGGSTLGFIKNYIVNKGRFDSCDIVSCEHLPVFYNLMCARIAHLLGNSTGPGGSEFICSVHAVSGPNEGFGEASKRRREFGVAPEYNLLSLKKGPFFFLARELATFADKTKKRILCSLESAISLSRYHVMRLLRKEVRKWDTAVVKDGMTLAEFRGYIKANTLSGKQRINIRSTDGNFSLDYYLLPGIGESVLWSHKDIDGTFPEFKDYVMFPAEGAFNIIYLDGRARVSCARRVMADGLLSPGGYIFMHDAYKKWYEKWLPDIYGPGKPFDGNNRRIDGSVLIEKAPGPDADLNRDELLIFQNR